MIEIRSTEKGFKAVAMPADVEVFRACFYETAVDQAFARDGDVRADGQQLERKRKMRWWERRDARAARNGRA